MPLSAAQDVRRAGSGGGSRLHAARQFGQGSFATSLRGISSCGPLEASADTRLHCCLNPSSADEVSNQRSGKRPETRDDAEAPLFRSAIGRTGELTINAMHRVETPA